MELDIWLGDRLVAHTVTRDGKVRIAYDGSVAEAYGPEVPLLSCSLPTPGPSEPAMARAYLEGLLPEGRALDSAAAQVRGVRLVDGAPEAPADTIALLAEYGRECAGAAVLLPSGEMPSAPGGYEPLDDDALADLIRDLPRHPLGSDLDRGIRMSLGGAQDKLLLAKVDGRWCLPLNGAPSTHIVKPTTIWPNSAHNEALVLDLARACGLTEYQSWVEPMGASPVLVVERFDRRRENGRIVRLHQEDMCQAIGMRPKQKYEIGRPSTRMAKVLRDFADAPREQTEILFRLVAFRAVVGDEDGHGKNYALLLDDGRVTVAPMYDCLCTLVYLDLSGTMAAPIGKQHTLAKVDRSALVAEARAMGMTESEANGALGSLAESLRRGIDELSSALVDDWPSAAVTDLIANRVERLESGKPLGGRGSQRSRAGGSLDRATATRQHGSDQ